MRYQKKRKGYTTAATANTTVRVVFQAKKDWGSFLRWVNWSTQAQTTVK